MAEDNEQATAAAEPKETAEQNEEGIRTDLIRDSECECTIRAQVEADYLEDRYEEQLDRLQEEAQVPGFRRGNAPRGLLSRRYGERVKADLLDQVIREAYQSALAENELSVVNTVDSPEPEELDWDVGDFLEFEFKCEILPSIELGEEHYKGLEVEVPEQEVTDEMLEEEMERFAQQMASWEEVEDGGIDVEDYIVADVHLRGESEPEWSDEIEFVPEEEQIGPFLAAGIKGAILGASAGDSIELEAELPEEEFPEEHDVLEEFVGEPVTLEIDIKEVYRREVPDIDDELAEQFNMENVEELRSFVRERLERNLEDRQEDITRQVLLDALLNKVDMEMPDSLVEQATQDEMRRLMMHALRAGRPREEAEQLARSNAHRSREIAVRNLKTSYLLRQVADAERIYVLDDEVQEQVRALAQRQGWSVERAQRYLEEEDMMSSLRWDLREAKTIEFLEENADITYVPADEFENPRPGTAGDEQPHVEPSAEEE